MKNNYIVIGITVLVMGVIIYMGREIFTLKSQLTAAKGNVSALLDTMRIEKTKNGELESVKLALLADKNTLKELSDSLYNEVKKEKGKVKYITTTNVTITHDTVEVQNTPVDSSLHWTYSHSDSGGSRLLSGITSRAVTKITKDELTLNLVTGLKERDDKKMEIFVRTRYPGVTFNNIEGAIIDPEKPAVKPPNRYFSFGPCLSTIVDPTGVIRFGVGVSVQWSLIKF